MTMDETRRFDALRSSVGAVRRFVREALSDFETTAIERMQGLLVSEERADGKAVWCELGKER